MFGFKELIIIAFVVLVLFGAGKLPSAMKNLGRGMKNFKDELGDDSKNTEDGEDNNSK